MLGEALDISRETYLAILMDRAYEGPVVVASPEGGVDIEEVAEKTPDKIYKVCLPELCDLNTRLFFNSASLTVKH